MKQDTYFEFGILQSSFHRPVSTLRHAERLNEWRHKLSLPNHCNSTSWGWNMEEEGKILWIFISNIPSVREVSCIYFTSTIMEISHPLFIRAMEFSKGSCICKGIRATVLIAARQTSLFLCWWIIEYMRWKGPSGSSIVQPSLQYSTGFIKSIRITNLFENLQQREIYHCSRQIISLLNSCAG